MIDPSHAAPKPRRTSRWLLLIAGLISVAAAVSFLMMSKRDEDAQTLFNRMRQKLLAADSIRIPSL